MPLVGKLGKVLKIGSRIAKGDETFRAGTKTLDYLSTRMPSALKDSYDRKQYEEKKKNKKKAFGGPLFNSRTPIESFQGGKQLPIVRY